MKEIYIRISIIVLSLLLFISILDSVKDIFDIGDITRSILGFSLCILIFILALKRSKKR
jgi:hypothetical protein